MVEEVAVITIELLIEISDHLSYSRDSIILQIHFDYINILQATCFSLVIILLDFQEMIFLFLIHKF